MSSIQKIAIVVARDRMWHIGSDGQLPWEGQLPSDMQRFKQITAGGAVIMGRKTHESIGKVLKGRLNIVLTRQEDYTSPFPHAIGDAPICVGTIGEAITTAGNLDIFVIGGAEIYAQFLELEVLNAFYDTDVAGDFKADTHFPVEALHQRPVGLRPLIWPVVEEHSRQAGLDGDQHASHFTRRVKPTPEA